MADPTLTKTLNALNVVTREHLLPGMVDQIKNNGSYLANILLQKAEPASGGTQIEQLLEYGNDRPRWMGEWDKVQYNVKDLATAALFDWKRLNDTIVFSELDLKVKNVGKERLLSLAKIGSKNLVKTFKRGFGDMLFKNSARATNEPYNLYDIVVNYNASLGGIDPTDTKYAWWQSRILALSGVVYSQVTDPDDASGYYLENIMGQMYDSLCSDNDHPTLIVTTRKIWRTYEQLLRNQNRYNSNMKVNGSFQVLMFDQAEVVADDKVPSGHIYFLNTNYLYFRYHPDFNFALSDYEKVTTGEKAYAAELDWVGALTCSNRGFQGVVTGVPENPLTIS